MNEFDPPRRSLLGEVALERSSVVANSRMNRERGLAGVNSYERELGIDPLAILGECLERSGEAAWLDLCCGTGKALVEAAASFVAKGQRVFLHGVDLVGMFCSYDADRTPVRLEVASIHGWTPTRRYDLITCVHGLHYIGDKLGLLERVVTWLAPEGQFAANLDLANLRWQDSRPMGRPLLAALQAGGFTYSRKKHVLEGRGATPHTFGYRYLGADDTAGPNYTGQEAVDSFYATATA